MSGLKFELRSDGMVSMTIPTEPEETTVVIDTGTVVDILNNLGDFRSAMKPEVPKEWKPGQKVLAQVDPIWYTEPEMMQGNTLLHLRDQRYGWLHYLIPRPEAKKLGQLLIQQAEIPSPEPTPGKSN